MPSPHPMATKAKIAALARTTTSIVTPLQNITERPVRLPTMLKSMPRQASATSVATTTASTNPSYHEGMKPLASAQDPPKPKRPTKPSAEKNPHAVALGRRGGKVEVRLGLRLLRLRSAIRSRSRPPAPDGGCRKSVRSRRFSRQKKYATRLALNHRAPKPIRMFRREAEPASSLMPLVDSAVSLA